MSQYYHIEQIEQIEHNVHSIHACLFRSVCVFYNFMVDLLTSL